MDACSASDGGNIVFPAGTYSAASIHLKSNVRFVLDKNAIITGGATGYDPPEPMSSTNTRTLATAIFTTR